MRELLAIRKREIVPRLAGAAFGAAKAHDNGLMTASWRMGDGARLDLTSNLSSSDITYQASQTPGTPIWGSEAGDRLPPWSVFWRLETS